MNKRSLSFEQLKERVGKPVFESDCKMWGIIDFDYNYPDKLYFCTEKNGVRFTLDISARELKLFDEEVQH